MAVEQPRRLTRNRAWTCFMANQFGAPGLGSIAGGRRVIGTLQLLLALAGVGLLAVWIFQFSRNLALKLIEDAPPPPLAGWWWRWGLICFGAGWLWSLVTSLILLRQASAEANHPNSGVLPDLAPAPSVRSRVPGGSSERNGATKK